MINKIKCFLLGHEWERIKEHYGNLDNGKALFKLTLGDCERCQKKRK